MKKNLYHFIACLGLLFFAAAPKCSAQTTPVDATTAAQLQTKLEALLATYNLKGLSASVIIPGKGTWNGATGFSHGNVLIDTSMVFAIGSVTKNFTASAVLLLQEDGLLSVTDSLHEYLPMYPNINPNITIKQLLQHTSGIYNYTNSAGWQNEVSTNPTQAMSVTHLLNNYIGTPAFAAGASFQYSNTNYLLLGLIIEEVTGQPYHAFVRQRLLNPLQLNSFYVADNEPATGVLPHNWSDPDFNGSATDISFHPLTAVFGTSAADGALVGNAHDLARYGQALFTTAQVLQDTSKVQMRTFRGTSGGSFTGYGLGLMRYTYQGQPVWGHGGNIAGYAASLIFSPSDSIVVSLLSNQDVMSHQLALALLGTARQSLISSTADGVTPASASLSCYPNPANGKGTIAFELAEPQQVQLTLRNSLGQEICSLKNGLQEAGKHQLAIETENLATGIYYCTLVTDTQTLVQRWILNQ